ncbi:hypothetical protein [Magnetovibrio blakemorei]|uniref:Uncharacterized protein n=1 Tax=Magnetovibrio blakemorei TaxID=28181 RepID=A0A1E5Q462_9PROT|nr:hypothetical protein [Magnetovibrio blakemorei]OEJ64809.1 hypothetical protein BEN30_15980 [Magnetovibrio blakemorei]
MSIIKTLEFSNVEAPKNTRHVSTLERAKSKFLDSINTQVSAVEAAIAGETFTITKKHYVTDEDGTRRHVTKEVEPRPIWFELDGAFYVAPKYANKPLVLGSNKSKPSIAAGKSLNDVLVTLNTIKQAVEAGELDKILEAQAIAARQRMSKK